MRALYLTLAAGFLSVGMCAAADEAAAFPILKLTLAKDQELTIALPSITSVSKHEFKLNGDTPVTQVTVNNTGSNTIRFYYVHPIEKALNPTSLKETSTTARKKATAELTQQKQENDLPAVKFPEGVYAHGIEYQVSSLQTLEDIYNVIVKAWISHARKVTEETIK